MKERQSPPARGELLERKIRFSIGKPPMLAVDGLEIFGPPPIRILSSEVSRIDFRT